MFKLDAYLKRFLQIAMRNQDVQLMRQMIKIYENIQKVSKTFPQPKPNTGSMTSLLMVPEAQIVRRQSEPNCYYNPLSKEHIGSQISLNGKSCFGFIGFFYHMNVFFDLSCTIITNE